MDGIYLEDEARAAVLSEKNILVVAGPGAGKTELLAQRAGFLFATDRCAYPRKILAISFKKDAAENLKERVVKRYGNEAKTRFVSLTYDSFGKSILDRFRLALPEGNIPNADYLINTDKTTDGIIDAAFRNEGYCPGLYDKPSATKRNYERIINGVELPLQGDSLGVKVWKELLTGAKSGESCLTFHMISKLAICIIRFNSQIRKAMQLTYSHIFLDEFQDTTDLQYELVRSCFLGSACNLTAVGDNKQRIMLWAGACKTVFSDFFKDFCAEEKRLIMNHRSAPRLVELQKLMYEALQDTKGKVEASDKWNEDDGDIQLLISENENSERRWMLESISNQIKNGLSPNEICILCKQKPADYTEDLIKELAANGINARVENDYQDLLKEPIVVLILSIIKLTINKRLPDEWEYLLEETALLMGNGAHSGTDDSYYEMLEGISGLLKQCKKIMLDDDKIVHCKNIIKEIVSFYGKDRIKAQYIVYAQGNYLSDVLKKFSTLFNRELIRTGYKWKDAIEGFEGINSIPIMTIHKSKGLEYSAVYFIGLEDSAFWNFKNQPEEDRCAFFVALSRAKQFIAFTYCEKRAGRKQHRDDINEFFELLQKHGMAEVLQI